MTTTPTPSPTCRDCCGSGRIRKVTIGRPPEANTETVACPCMSGPPTTNPYAEERARAEAPAADVRVGSNSDALVDAMRKAGLATRCCAAALDLRDSGVSLIGFATGDLLAHYDRMVGPRHEANLAKQRESKAEDQERWESDRAPVAVERLAGYAWTTWGTDGPGSPRFRPEARHDGSDTHDPEPAPEPAPAPAPDEPEPMYSTVYSWPELTSGGRARRKPKAARCEVKTVQLPNAPARIPDDHLLAAIAGTDGDS